MNLTVCPGGIAIVTIAPRQGLYETPGYLASVAEPKMNQHEISIETIENGSIHCEIVLYGTIGALAID